jgi:hypothetical protein
MRIIIDSFSPLMLLGRNDYHFMLMILTCIYVLSLKHSSIFSSEMIAFFNIILFLLKLFVKL